MRVPQIVTYVVVNKETGHKGALRRTKITPLRMHTVAAVADKWHVSGRSDNKH